MTSTGPARAEIVVDLAAIRHNVRLLRELVGPDVAMMTVVKADGYGHGMVAVARAAREAGAEWLGVATLDEALALRAAGDTGRVLCWLAVPGEDYAGRGRRRRRRDGVLRRPSSTRSPSPPAGGPAVQLKVDTGLSRGGAARADWHDALRHAARARAGRPAATSPASGRTSRASDEPDHPANDAQEAAFREAGARRGGRAATRAAAPRQLRRRDPAARRSRFDLVRCGIASYGLDPAPGAHHRPRPRARP